MSTEVRLTVEQLCLVVTCSHSPMSTTLGTLDIRHTRHAILKEVHQLPIDMLHRILDIFGRERLEALLGVAVLDHGRDHIARTLVGGTPFGLVDNVREIIRFRYAPRAVTNGPNEFLLVKYEIFKTVHGQVSECRCRETIINEYYFVSHTV